MVIDIQGRDTSSRYQGGGNRRLLIASNRGPVEHHLNDSGEVTRVRCAGGVATALGAAVEDLQVTWIAGAASPADREVAEEAEDVPLGGSRRLHLVSTPQDAYDLFYQTFCNPILWFIQHGMGDRLRRDDLSREALHAWERGYLPVNLAFAEAVVDELRKGDAAGSVILHDYHLYAAPLLVRNLCPRATLQFFVHIPWPAPDAWRQLPDTIVASICESLLANDSVVFQTEASAANFVRTCRAYLPDVSVYGNDVVRNGTRTYVWANPISVNPHELRARVETPDAQAYFEKLSAGDGVRTIVRVDRLDPAKNIAGGFEAYRLMLERHPEWRGRVRMLACLVPTRTGIPEYESYAREVFDLVDDINARFGTETWQPVTVYYEHNRLQALIALTMYDVLLVNSIADGMNLVSKEGAIVNQRDGVLVLSTSAGSYDELKDGALAVLPDDIEGTADALAYALALPAPERRARAQELRQAVLDHQLSDWLRLLLDEFAPGAYKQLAVAGVR